VTVSGPEPVEIPNPVAVAGGGTVVDDEVDVEDDVVLVPVDVVVVVVVLAVEVEVDVGVDVAVLVLAVRQFGLSGCRAQNAGGWPATAAPAVNRAAQAKTRAARRMRVSS
jgi:hypothetical protein